MSAASPPRRGLALTRPGVKYASFAHSAAYVCLLVVWAIPGLAALELVFGFAHGVGWILMCLVVLEALRRRLIDLRLAVAIAVLGAIGPFIGSAEFVRQDAQRA